MFEISSIEIDNKINGREISKETIENLHSWIWNHPHVVYHTLTNIHVKTKDNTTDEVIKAQNLLIQIQIRELHNWLIKLPL